MVHAQTRIHHGERNAQNSQGFWNTNRIPYPGQKTGIPDNYQDNINVF